MAFHTAWKGPTLLSAVTFPWGPLSELESTENNNISGRFSVQQVCARLIIIECLIHPLYVPTYVCTHVHTHRYTPSCIRNDCEMVDNRVESYLRQS